MNLSTEKVVGTFRQLALIPTVVSGTLLKENESVYKLESVWQQKDLERTENIVFSKWSTITARGSEFQCLNKFPPVEVNKEAITRYSHCGNFRAVIREVVVKNSEKVQYLEVWGQSRKIINISFKDEDRHGEVLTNGQFGCLEWSEDGKKILYVAEQKLPKTCSYFKTAEKDSSVKPGNEHLWKESWGEQLTESHHPTVCVFDLESKEISMFSDVIPKEISAGQAIWHHDNESIIFVGWAHEPFRLGLIYCPIRLSHLYLLNTKSNTCVQVSSGDYAVHGPKLHPKGDDVFYLQNPIGGPHMNCSKLMSVKISSPESGSKVVVDSVKFASSEDCFPGLFSMYLQRKCLTSDGRYFLMSTAWRSHKSIVSVDVETGMVKRLTGEGNWGILDIEDDIVVASYSTPSNSPEIRIAKFDPESSLTWVTVDKPSDNFSSIQWSVHSYEPELKNLDFPHIDCEYILLQPDGDAVDLGNKSLIIFPHGGPHSHCVTEFAHGTAGLCLLGFTVAQINYRGSMGFGQDGIDCLPGKIGTQDVKDVQQVAERMKSELHFDKVFVTGGSHGGFLTLHLISQYPDFYQAACARNPVCNVAVMSGVSDIPDWSYCEAGLSEYTLKTLPDAKYYTSMLEKSPIAHIQKAKAPCLMMLGDVDLRCPPRQGLQWARAYKALGKNCKVLEYKDNNHPLAKVDAEADGFVNSVMWFKEHENRK